MSENNTIDKEKAGAEENQNSTKSANQSDENQVKDEVSENENTKHSDSTEQLKEDTEDNKAKEDATEVKEEQELTVEEKLKLEVDVQKDKYLRLFAEFENYKRRTSKERLELFKTAGQEVMQSMLPVIDDFDRALKEISKSDDKDAVKGVELIYSKLKDTLKAKGLEEMSVKIGDTFDGDLHEAITQIPAPEEKLKGKIIDIVEKGYTLGEKIIRYPKVVTGK